MVHSSVAVIALVIGLAFVSSVSGAVSAMHIVCSGDATGRGTRVRSSIERDVMATYIWDRPLWAFDLPMDSMYRQPGVVRADYEELHQLLSGRPDYWLARVYANFNNDLDMFIRFGYDPGMIYHYVLKVPMDVYEGCVPDDNGLYADPRNWYLATEKNYVAKYSEADFDIYWGRRGRLCKTWSMMRYLCN